MKKKEVRREVTRTGESNHIPGGESNGAETTNKLAQTHTRCWNITIRRGLTRRFCISSSYFHIPIRPSELQPGQRRINVIAGLVYQICKTELRSLLF